MDENRGKKYLITTWIVVAFILLLFLSLISEEREKESEYLDLDSLKQKYYLIDYYYYFERQQYDDKYNIDDNEKNTVKNNIDVEKDDSSRPNIESVPMSDELLEYTYQLSVDYEIPYTLILAIINVESNFDETVISKTKDYGLAQINYKYVDWMASEAGIEHVDPLNPKHNILMAIWYLDYLKKYWDKYDMSEEDKFFLVVLSYNKGIEGAKAWIRDNGWKSKYVDKVLEAKIFYEKVMEV